MKIDRKCEVTIVCTPDELKTNIEGLHRCLGYMNISGDDTGLQIYAKIKNLVGNLDALSGSNS